jgi:hypothetical protein
MGNKYTNEGLPVILLDTIETGLRDDIKYLGEDLNLDNTYEDIKEILDLENPLMSKILDGFRIAAPNEVYKASFTAGFAEAYKILRRQAEKNKLEENLD